MTMSQMATLTVILVVVLVGMRTGLFRWLVREVPRWMTHGAYGLKRRRAGLDQRSVEVAGERAWFLEGGNQYLNTVLLLHDFAGEKENWADLAGELLSAELRVVAVDLPGFGQSERSGKLRYDITNMTRRVLGFVREIGLGATHLVGSGIGGTIAASLAYAEPKRFVSLTMIEPYGVRVPYPSELDRRLERGSNPYLLATTTAYDNLIDFLFVERPKVSGPIQRQRAEKLVEDRVFLQRVWKELREGDRANLLDLILPEISFRTLVIWGERSRMLHPKTAEVIRGMMSDARVALIRGAGHLPHMEQPKEVGAAIVSFIRQG